MKRRRNKMSIDNKVPAIRFKGFSGAWEEKDLNCEVDFYSGLTYSPNDVIKEVGTFVLRSSNVKNGQIIDADNVYVNSAVVNSENVSLGDIIVVVRNGSRSLIGKHAQVTQDMKKTVIGAFMTGIRAEHSNFINALLDTNQFNKEIEKNLGATINQITTGAFKKMRFWFSTAEEQKKIGNYFQQINTLISLHQQKHDKLLNLKKSLLEKMFPKQGRKEPEIRFKGFSGEWEERALWEIAEFNPKTELPVIFEYVDLESVSGTEMISHRSEIKSSAPSRAQRLARKGDVFYQTVRPYQKNNYLFDKTENNYVFSTGYAQMRPCGDSYFLLSLVQNSEFVRSVLDNCTGTSYPAINSSDLANIQSHFPRKKEQSKIGNFFKQLDTLLNHHQAQLKKLNNIKQACLEKMFV